MNTCNGPECSNKTLAKGLCNGHYQQFKKGYALTPLRRRSKTTIRDEDGNKQCCRCFAWKPVDDFYGANASTTKDGLLPYCKSCDAAAARLRKYGISNEAFLSLLEAQHRLCLICFKAIDEKTAAIDHDHSCCPGKTSCGNCLRGLLCINCNLVLGMFSDSSSRFLRAAKYLEHYNGVDDTEFEPGWTAQQNRKENT